MGQAIQAVQPPTGNASVDSSNIAAALASGAARVQLAPGTYEANQSFDIPSNCDFHGAGAQSTTINWSTDLGSGESGLIMSDGVYGSASTVADLALSGPGGYTIGDATGGAQMYGLQTGSGSRVRNIFSTGFYAGTAIAHDHESIVECVCARNWYGAYHFNANDAGNQSYVKCALNSNYRAGLAVASGAVCDLVGFDACNFADQPVGLFKEGANPTNSFLVDTRFSSCGFENLGNAILLDAATTGTQVSVQNVTFQTCGAINWSGLQYDSSLSLAATFNLWTAKLTVIDDEFGVPTGGSHVYYQRGGGGSDGGTLRSDRIPAASDLNGTWAGTYSGTNGYSATILRAETQLTQGQALQLQDSGSVKPMFADNSHAFIGVAATDAAPDTPVAVVQSGLCQVLSTDAVPFPGIYFECDPDNVGQVRAVNRLLGRTAAPPYRPASPGPTVAVSNSSCAASSLCQAILVGPSYDSGLVAPSQISTLPAAGESYRGQVLIVQGDGLGTADVAYVCLLSSAGTYSWKQIVSG
ncbi:MAG TPA: hypothetical protein VGI50_13595 [Solirubrobacteraceae bacterium]